MDIKIRDIDPLTIKKIDTWAKEKGLSRQQFLKEHLETFAVNDIHSNIIDHYEKQLETNTLLLEKTEKTMNELVLLMSELINGE